MKWIVEQISNLTGYIIYYAEFGDHVKAQSVYDELKERDTISTVAIYKKIDNRQLVE